MACSNCNTPTCGCSGTYVVSATCPPACAEVFNAQCIVYTGSDIVCGSETVIARNAYLDTALANIVDYICTSTLRIDDTSVPLQACSAGVPVNLTQNLGKQYCKLLIIDVATNNDVTSDFAITLTSVGNYTITPGSFTGNVRIIAQG